MKSIDKLRKTLKDCTTEAGIEPDKFDTYWITANACDMLIDEIEAEIKRDYMRLPVDADGVPIYVGDEIQYVNEHGGTGAKVKVCAIADGYAFYDNGKHIHAYSSDSTRHVKPRTLEDVLVDMLEDAVGYSDAHTDVSLVAVEKYADEIRELLGGDA